ncbi:MAG: EF-hand domain-containing protein [Sphingomicrobium sp.]
MGEPFRPATRDESGLADWFRQADRNHDGQLTLDEMQADADRFFALLDVNHDGEIDPDEITHYETVVAPEISSGPQFAMAAMDSAPPEGGDGGWGHGGGGGGGDGHHRPDGGGGKFFRGGNDEHQGAARYGLLDLPEPVTAADSNFNRGISPEEFRQAAGQRFLALDLDHHGLPTLSGLAKIRPAPPAQPNRKGTAGQAPSDDTPDSDAAALPANY